LTLSRDSYLRWALRLPPPLYLSVVFLPSYSSTLGVRSFFFPKRVFFAAGRARGAGRFLHFPLELFFWYLRLINPLSVFATRFDESTFLLPLSLLLADLVVEHVRHLRRFFPPPHRGAGEREPSFVCAASRSCCNGPDSFLLFALLLASFPESEVSWKTLPHSEGKPVFVDFFPLSFSGGRRSFFRFEFFSFCWKPHPCFSFRGPPLFRLSLAPVATLAHSSSQSLSFLFAFFFFWYCCGRFPVFVSLVLLVFPSRLLRNSLEAVVGVFRLRSFRAPPLFSSFPRPFFRLRGISSGGDPNVFPVLPFDAAALWQGAVFPAPGFPPL